MSEAPLPDTPGPNHPPLLIRHQPVPGQIEYERSAYSVDDIFNEDISDILFTDRSSLKQSKPHLHQQDHDGWDDQPIRENEKVAILPAWVYRISGLPE